MLKAPPRQKPQRRKAADPNGTRSILSSRRYRTWRARIAQQRMARCDVCWARDQRITDFAHFHHIKPRQSFPELVMDADNVQLLCVDHHNEQHSSGVDLNRPLNCIAICGPPCSGKSTYARQIATPADILWDWDNARQSLGLDYNSEIEPAQWQRLLDMRKEAIRQAQDTDSRLLLITTHPKSKLVSEAASSVVVMRATLAVCLERLERRQVELKLSSMEAARQRDAIEEWFR